MRWGSMARKGKPLSSSKPRWLRAPCRRIPVRHGAASWTNGIARRGSQGYETLAFAFDEHGEFAGDLIIGGYGELSVRADDLVTGGIELGHGTTPNRRARQTPSSEGSVAEFVLEL